VTPHSFLRGVPRVTGDAQNRVKDTRSEPTITPPGRRGTDVPHATESCVSRALGCGVPPVRLLPCVLACLLFGVPDGVAATAPDPLAGVRVIVPASYQQGTRRYPVAFVAAQAARLEVKSAEVMVVMLPSAVDPEALQRVRAAVAARYRTLAGTRHTAVVGFGSDANTGLRLVLDRSEGFGFAAMIDPVPDDATRHRAWHTDAKGLGFFVAIVRAGDPADTEGTLRLFGAFEYVHALRTRGARVGVMEFQPVARDLLWSKALSSALKVFASFSAAP